MTPTLLIGDHIVVNELDRSPPRPGDVIVFIWPKDRTGLREAHRRRRR